jgi:hypothetical protein
MNSTTVLGIFYSLAFGYIGFLFARERVYRRRLEDHLANILAARYEHPETLAEHLSDAEDAFEEIRYVVLKRRVKQMEDSYWTRFGKRRGDVTPPGERAAALAQFVGADEDRILPTEGCFRSQACCREKGHGGPCAIPLDGDTR